MSRVLIVYGIIVVLNSADGQLRYYGAEGRHLFSVSRPGDRPGEMRGGPWLDRLGGDVVQVSHGSGRLRYGPNGNCRRRLVELDLDVSWPRRSSRLRAG